MSEEITKLRRKRGVSRTAVTSLLKKIESLLAHDKPNFDELEESLAQLEQKKIDLKNEDCSIENLIEDMSELEKEVTTSLEYYDKITLWKFRISKKLKENKKASNSVIHIDSDNSVVEKTNVVKLPTLKIERFYGDISLFQDFWHSFKTAIHENESLTSIDKMNYLKSFLGGIAANAISGFSLSHENYEAAIELLLERFGKKDLIITNHINTLLALKPVYRSNEVISLRKLFDSIQVQVRSLKSLGIDSSTFDTLLIPIILKALPVDLSLEFNRQSMKNASKDSCSNIDELLSFIRIELEAREKQRLLHQNIQLDTRNRNFPEANRNKHLTGASSQSIPKVINRVATDKARDHKTDGFNNCFYCESTSHTAKGCKNISISEKIAKLKSQGKCYLCLGARHLKKFCKSNVKCEFCKGRHHSSICSYLFQGDNESDKDTNLLVESTDNNALIARVSSNALFNLERPQKGKSLIASLPTMEVECNNRILTGICDTGTELSVIKSSFVPEYYKNPCGSVLLQSAFGHTLKAPLINVPLSKLPDKFNCKVFPKVVITCAMVDCLVNDLLLSLSACNELNGTEFNKIISNENNGIVTNANCSNDILSNNEEFETINISEQDSSLYNDPNESITLELPQSASDILSVNEVNTDSNTVPPNSNNDSDCFTSDSARFKSEQIKDSSLKQCWSDAENKVNSYFVYDNLLYHRDKVLGETVHQLVVPESRRQQLLELAHSSPWGGHLRNKKTIQRLKYSFYWPRIKNDVRDFCEKCISCQLRAKPNKFDNTPITPVTRPDEPFQIINVDLIGPIEPSSSGFKYVLCAVDQCTRWPEAVSLRNISAKSTCEALLQIFARTGIPRIVASDQGSNFTSALTQEFMKRIGTSPRFSVPGYPQSNGLVERWNNVLKGMIHHTIRENARNWHKHIPFLLWAYREVPNATTDVSPFQMLYGRRPTGPLSILKSSWTNEIPLPCGQLGSVTNYLNDLKMKLEKAAEHAGISCSKKQKAYAYYHNRKTRHKEFKSGDQVVVLIPDSNHKLYARWTAPATIIEKKSPYSYLVQLPDNTLKHIHANKIRELKVQTTHVGVIYDSDIDFGNIESAPQITNKNQDLCNEISLHHLPSEERKQLSNVLGKHSNLQSGIPKISKVGEHVIRLKPDSRPKRQKAYRIPEALKKEVDRQIEELLRLGLIEHSESEYAHPVVCVGKKDSTIRLCVDYRYLNAQTEIDSFPMTNATDLIYKVAQAKFITLLDLLKGYWQIRLNKDCKHLTSFVTHRGQYSFVVMPFGLRNAAATFQRVMNRILVQHKAYAETYIDDVVIFSADWNSHLEHLNAVLHTLEEANLTVNFKKCSFARPQIKFLGHIVGSGTHAPDPDKVSAIQNLETPKSKKDVKSVLGLLSYYRSYVSAFSDIARPLIELTKKRAPKEIIWSEACEKAFKELKQAISNAPIFYSPDFHRPFIIYADASTYAIGACLAQKDKDDREHPIAFTSKKLSKCQEGYATIEKEAYAVIFALKKFEHYIYNTQVSVVSDHNPLKFLTDCAPQSARLQRWALALQRFQAQVTYRRGKLHINADSLSRLHASHWT